MKTEVHTYDTSASPILDITTDVQQFLGGASEGLLNVFVPHATAGVAVMETGAGSESDLEATLDRLLPRDDRWTHRHGSPGHGADHLLPAFISPSVSIPILDGHMQLGTWQSIVLVDLNRDNPQRKVRFSLLEG
ncbi:MAG: YjbQ family protein [Actinobacteria bacterium]|jgi:secondary thiamine-phosphate synthase enzyme|nr:YjbQ family protein [Actinomycetota bacterium]